LAPEFKKYKSEVRKPCIKFSRKFTFVSSRLIVKTLH